MNSKTLIGLINNTALLLALALIYDTIALKRRAERPVAQVLVGILIGAAGIAVMLIPWEFSPGVIFDTRSILLSVGGLFFGSIPTLMAVLMTSAFRLFQGGGGAWTGVAVIITSGGIGLAWRHLRKKWFDEISPLELYIFGISVHINMLLCMLSLPQPIAAKVLSTISLPVMLIYPAGTTLLGMLMVSRLAHRQMEQALRESEKKLRQQNLEIKSLYYASEALFSSDEPDTQELAKTIVETILNEFDQSNCSLFIVDQKAQQLRRAAAAGPYSAEVKKGQLKLDGPGLVPASIRSGEIINVPDVLSHPGYVANWDAAHSEMAIPLKIDKRVIGVIDVQTAQQAGFNKKDERLISIFANRAALALQSAHLFNQTRQQAEELKDINITLEERVRQRTSELQVFNELSREIGYTLEYTELFELMFRHLHRVMDYDVAAGLIRLDDHCELHLRSTRPLPAAVQQELVESLTGTFSRMSGQPLNRENLRIRPLTPDADIEITPIAQLGSKFQVPLITGTQRQIVGLLFIGAEQEAAFDENAIRLIYTLSNQASVSIQRLRDLRAVEQKRLETLVDRIPAGVLLLDEDKHLVLTNPAGDEYLALLTGSTQGETLTHLGEDSVENLLRPRDDGHPHEISITDPTRHTFEVDSRPVETGPEAGGWVLTLRDVTWERDLLAAEKSRRQELDGLYTLSRELSKTDLSKNILTAIVKQAIKNLHVTFARLLLLEDDTFRCRSAHPLRVLKRDLGVDEANAKLAWPHYQRALREGEPLILNRDDPRLSTEEKHALYLDMATYICLTPLKVGLESLGVLVLGEIRNVNREPFDKRKFNLATTIADQAASALQRASLHEETSRHLQRLNALCEIDKVISTSLDLELIISVIIQETLTQLGVNAADILLYNPNTLALEYAHGSGFISEVNAAYTIHASDDPAWQALYENEITITENIDFKSRHLAEEYFVVYCCVPLIAKGNKQGVLEIFHRKPLPRDEDWLGFLKTLAGQAAIAIDNAALFENLQSSNFELFMAYDSTLVGWADALELRDIETEGHSQRVTKLSLRLANALGIDTENIEHIRRGALLHDIGKMGVPDVILFKPGKLNQAERKIIEQHPVFAYNMLKSIKYLRPSLDIPLYHHERWDGSGYPEGLKGEKIPLSARLFAVVDVWDALISDRPYRKAWPKEKALAHIRAQSGKHFDPQVVEVFLELVEG